VKTDRNPGLTIDKTKSEQPDEATEAVVFGSGSPEVNNEGKYQYLQSRDNFSSAEEE